MTNDELKVGITAVFDPEVTPHARTFLRALATARNHIPALARVNFVFADDAADPECARTVAENFVAQGVDLVIGHFSSDAALAAIDTYEKADIAMLTPAATANAVTASPAAFRLCPNDALLAANLLALCIQKEWRNLHVRSDDSAHGKAIAEAIRVAAAEYGVVLTDTTNKAHAVVFAGRIAPSGAYMRQHLQSDPGLPLILTDDAVSPQLAGQSGLAAPILAIGFRSAQSYPDAALVCEHYRLLFGSPPETYFLESYAALEILASLVDARPRPRMTKALGAGQFETALGPVQFENGQATGLTHAVWSLGANGFSVEDQDIAVQMEKPQAVAAPTPAFADQRMSS